MTTFFNIFKKPKKIPIFWVKNFFLENPALSRTTSYGFLASCQNLEKLMLQFQENAEAADRMD